MNRDNIVESLLGTWDRVRESLCGGKEWPELSDAMRSAEALNPLFTPYMQKRALLSLADGFFKREIMYRWLGSYPELGRCSGMKVGIVAAGNIPAVSAHDLLSSLVAGADPVVKLSSKDPFLLPLLFPQAQYCTSIDPDILERGTPKVDALISMGSSRTADLLRSEFSSLPTLVRGSRYSVGVISGEESPSDLEALAEDIFLYYGMGCRNISLLMLPYGYDPELLCKPLNRFIELHLEGKMNGSVRRSRAVYSMKGEKFFDGGGFLIRWINDGQSAEKEVVNDLFSLDMGSIWGLRYGSEREIGDFVEKNSAGIQKMFRTFGFAQNPFPWDYPDGIDIVRFLEGVAAKK